MSENYPSESEIVWRGRLFEMEQTTQPDGRVFEKAVRAPGVRLIIPNKDSRKLLLTREFRKELNAWDLRLPGGKVFDSLEEYETHRKSGADIMEAAVMKAQGEGAEEAGVDIQDVQLVRKSTLGATVEWDLYIFEAKQWSEHPKGQSLEEGEQIEPPKFYDYNTVKEFILEGKMQEDRIAMVLLQWLHQQ